MSEPYDPDPSKRRQRKAIDPTIENFDDVNGEMCLFCNLIVGSYVKWQDHMLLFHTDDWLDTGPNGRAKDIPKIVFRDLPKPVWRTGPEEDIPKQRGKFKFH